MTIKYRAIHTKSSWRKVNSHTSLEKAINGAHGAKNLLRKKGEVKKRWDTYGRVLCVLVWDEFGSHGYAFRLKDGSSDEVDTVEIPVNVLERYEQEKGCSTSEIDSFFQHKINNASLTHGNKLNESDNIPTCNELHDIKISLLKKNGIETIDTDLIYDEIENIYNIHLSKDMRSKFDDNCF